MSNSKPYSIDDLPADAPSIPGSSALPTGTEIVDAITHPAWTRCPSNAQERYALSYTHRGGQLPVNTPDTAWARAYGGPLNIRYDPQADALRFKPDNLLDTNDCTPLPQTLDELADVIYTELHARHHLYEYQRFRTIQASEGSYFSGRTLAELRSNYGTLYSLYVTHEIDDQDVAELTDAELQGLHTNLDHVENSPTWALLVQCPNCANGYKDVFHSDFERSIEMALHLTYCPVCLHDDISIGTTVGPRDFPINE